MEDKLSYTHQRPRLRKTALRGKRGNAREGGRRGKRWGVPQEGLGRWWLNVGGWERDEVRVKEEGKGED